MSASEHPPTPRWRLDWRRATSVLLLITATAATGWVFREDRPAAAAAQRLILVLPDTAADDPAPQAAWQHAAEELGLKLEPMSASELLRQRGRPDDALILPDTVHRRIGDALLATLRERVRAGNRLMLVHDAGLQDVDGRYHDERSRLSDLAGVDYALYGELGTGMLRETEVQVLPQHLDTLGVPPGKLVHGAEDLPDVRPRSGPTDADDPPVLAGYRYGRLRYASFATRGALDGTLLMQAPDGSVIAGERAVGAGQVLFVNLPLTQLKLSTDGLLLHAFLQHFARDLAGLPQLSPVPEGIGAVIMNWHVDDRKALPALERAAELGAFDPGLGPYSIHLTVGPDVDRPGDGRGMDLPGNPQAQAWVQRLAAQGHEIGSHGGWIHNQFGAEVGTMPRAQAAELIERNLRAIERFSGRPVREYSAPVGNHPAWVSGWLQDNGIGSYYFTGDTGMAPTRSFQDGRVPRPDLWSFPVLGFGRQASFEEARASGLPEQVVADWLDAVSDFCADQGTLRLVYFHPIGLVMYPRAFQEWLRHSRALTEAGRLRWMTMDQYTRFARRRLATQWSLQPQGTGLQLQASHAESLAGLTWLLPAARHARPTVLTGDARIDRQGTRWRIRASGGHTLTVRLDALPA
ncbi:MAG: hypothetical protein RLZZ592_1479 [Pseudomonadota bacterium]|jgi:hypothetical protein